MPAADGQRGDAEGLPARVAATLARDGLLAGVGELVVSLSGGPDSVALLLALAMHPVRPLRVLHFDHGLRPEAPAEAVWCQALCQRLGLPCEVVSLAVPQARRPNESVEMAARRLRLAWWRQAAATQPGLAVALGHHQDDALELLLLRLGRGSSRTGLTGLRSRRELHGVIFLRPLLEESRASILAFLAARGQDYQHDASNADLSIPRNRVRHEVLPALSAASGGLAGLRRSLTRLRQEDAFLQAEARRLAVALGEQLPEARLLSWPTALAGRVLLAWLRPRLAPLTVRGAWVDMVLHAARQRAQGLPAARQRLVLHPSLALVWQAGQWHLERAAGVASPRPGLPLGPWDYREQPMLAHPTAPDATPVAATRLLLRASLIPGPGLPAHLSDTPPPPEPTIDGLPLQGSEVFDAEQVGPLILVRQRQPGDRLVPWGWQRPARLKFLLNGARLPPAARAQAMVLTLPNGEILWVPGVRRAALAGISPATGWQLRLDIYWN